MKTTTINCDVCEKEINRETSLTLRATLGRRPGEDTRLKLNSYLGSFERDLCGSCWQTVQSSLGLGRRHLEMQLEKLK